ncbi:MAG: peptide ABC transporter substrate-binding protein [Treponema sp.]|nr:peptide ABC transporter substrate-binding protein [Treponema sp.]
MKADIKRFLSVVLLIFLGGFIWAQNNQFQSENLQSDIDLKNDTLTIVEPVYSHNLNPQTTSYSSDAQILSGLYEGLFSYDPVTLSPTYAIAVDYRISRDKKRWSFTINPNACFSNGEKITAYSVRDSWLNLLADPMAAYASLLDVVKGAADYRNGLCSAEEVGIYVDSDEVLSIHLVQPANYLPKLLCHSAFSVIHRSPTVYSGPFYLDDMEEGFYKMKKNPYYWDKDNVKLNEICFFQSNDAVENAFYFNTGMADWVTANLDTSMLINKNAFTFNAEFATCFLFFKQNSSIWDNLEFRTALFEAIPWDALRNDYYVGAKTFVYPLAGYPDVDGFSYTDVNEAKILMDAAREKYNVPQDKVLQIILEIPENSFSNDRLAALSDAWAQLGVELLVRQKSTYDYFMGVKASDADLFVYTWVGDFADPLAFLELFRGGSTLNDSGWNNKEFDRLIDEAAEGTEEERYRLLAQAETILLDDCMVIPVHHPVIYNVIDKNVVGGWSENAFDFHPLKYLYKKIEKSTVPNIVKK